MKTLTIGRRIAAARLKLEWTQQRLADVVGVHRVTVDAWEHGRKTPVKRSLVALSAVLGVQLQS